MTYLFTQLISCFCRRIQNKATKTQSKIVCYEKGVSTSSGMVRKHSIGKMNLSL